MKTSSNSQVDEDVLVLLQPLHAAAAPAGRDASGCRRRRRGRGRQQLVAERLNAENHLPAAATYVAAPAHRLHRLAGEEVRGPRVGPARDDASVLLTVGVRVLVHLIHPCGDAAGRRRRGSSSRLVPAHRRRRRLGQRQVEERLDGVEERAPAAEVHGTTGLVVGGEGVDEAEADPRRAGPEVVLQVQRGGRAPDRVGVHGIAHSSPLAAAQPHEQARDTEEPDGRGGGGAPVATGFHHGGRAVTVAVLPSADEDESRMRLKTVTTFVGWFSCIESFVIRWMDQCVLLESKEKVD